MINYSKFQDEIEGVKLTPYEIRENDFIECNLDRIKERLFVDKKLKDGEYFWVALTEQDRKVKERTKMIDEKIIIIKDKQEGELRLIKKIREWDKFINNKMMNLSRRHRSQNKCGRNNMITKKSKSIDNIFSKNFYDIVGFYFNKKGRFIDFKILTGCAGYRYYINKIKKGGRQRTSNNFNLHRIPLFKKGDYIKCE
jgi:hypothetical protein